MTGNDIQNPGDYGILIKNYLSGNILVGNCCGFTKQGTITGYKINKIKVVGGYQGVNIR